jgi:hypothetical protein
MSNEDSFYPRLIIQEYFDTLAVQLGKETELLLAESRATPVAKDTADRLNAARKQMLAEIERLKELNLKNYARNADMFQASLDNVRTSADMSEEKKINIIYKLLFSVGYCFFIESTPVTMLKRLVVLDCFPNNNNIYDNSKEYCFFHIFSYYIFFCSNPVKFQKIEISLILSPVLIKKS